MDGKIEPLAVKRRGAFADVKVRITRYPLGRPCEQFTIPITVEVSPGDSDEAIRREARSRAIVWLHENR